MIDEPDNSPETDFNPRGTVRRQFVDGPGNSQPGGDALDRVAPGLVAFGELHRLGDAEVWSAIELARLPGGLGAPERVALAVLVCVTQANRLEGSTMLPVEVGQPGPLDRWLESIGEAGVGSGAGAGSGAELLEEPARLREAIDGLLDGDSGSRGAADVIGDPGEYRPLVWDGRALYHHRLLACERQLVDLLGRRPDEQEDGRRLGPGFDSTSVDAAMASLAEAMPRLDGYDETDAEETAERMELNARQKEAVRAAATERLTLVSGGPGTGKTAVVVSMLRVMARLGVEPEAMAVAAPTGKAANRMGEEIRRQLAGLDDASDDDAHLRERLAEPETLHRLLGFSPRTDDFRFDETNPLAVDFVVVDEASMVDVFLMRQLAGAVPPDAHLVLVGDADQLPSVRNGAVFRDLVEAPSHREQSAGPGAAAAGLPEMTSVRLTKSYRMREETSGGAAILRVARVINAGDFEAAGAGETLRPVDGTVFRQKEEAGEELQGVGIAESEAAVEAILDGWFDRFLDHRLLEAPMRRREAEAEEGGRFVPEDRRRAAEAFRRRERAQLLTLTRVFATGSMRLNARFHARFARRRPAVADHRFLAGEPVIMSRNDYDLGLFNGDQGLIVRIAKDGQVRPGVLFRRRDGFRAVGLARVRDDIEHAYALTVHKAQGSEFEHVALMLPRQDVSLLTRELLYTGFTRASRSVTVLGDRGLLQTGAGRPMERYTGLSGA